MATIIENIARGVHDKDLDAILTAVIGRRSVIQQDNKNKNNGAIKAGDVVRFSEPIRPKYLIGRTAIVTKVNDKSYIVACPDDPGYGRFQNMKKVRCPSYLIEAV